MKKIQDFASSLLTDIIKNTLSNITSTSGDVMIRELGSYRCFNSLMDHRIKKYCEETLRSLFAFHNLESWITDKEKKSNVIKYVTKAVSDIRLSIEDDKKEDKDSLKKKSIRISKELDHAISKGLDGHNYFADAIEEKSVIGLEKIDHWLEYGADPSQKIVEGEYKDFPLILYAILMLNVGATRKLLKAGAILTPEIIRKWQTLLSYAAVNDRKLYRLLSSHFRSLQQSIAVREIKNNSSSILSLDAFFSTEDKKQTTIEEVLKKPMNQFFLIVFFGFLLYSMVLGVQNVPFGNIVMILFMGFIVDKMYGNSHITITSSNVSGKRDEAKELQRLPLTL